MSENVSLAEVKNRLSEFVERIEREHDRVVITKHGRPAAVVMSVDDLESLEETLAVITDSEAVAENSGRILRYRIQVDRQHAEAWRHPGRVHERGRRSGGAISVSLRWC